MQTSSGRKDEEEEATNPPQDDRKPSPVPNDRSKNKRSKGDSEDNEDIVTMTTILCHFIPRRIVPLQPPLLLQGRRRRILGRALENPAPATWT
mmetsp:Transcript_11222/g.26976  ORF Transcript_11222/g.26976 Transcript_11222/m.26976 type:complete len:93 (-) Transcript_11222:610-888(-)